MSVMDEIQDYLSDDKTLREAAEYLYENQIAGTPYKKALEAKRDDLDKKIENILGAIEGEAKFDVFQERFQRLELERKTSCPRSKGRRSRTPSWSRKTSISSLVPSRKSTRPLPTEDSSSSIFSSRR